MDKIDLRYQRGKIYTVRCYDDDSLIYVGSTIQKYLSVRMAKHRCNETCSLYKYVIDNFNGNWKNWYIELYEEYPCNNKAELNKREGEIIRLIANINQRIAGRTRKEFLNDNKEKNKDYHKKYYEDNKEKILEHKKKYKSDNKEIISEKNKKYYEDNKQKKLEKVICNHCGSEIIKVYLKRHQNTKKCKNYIN